MNHDGTMPPTAKQLRYLKSLALRAGATFTPPRTRTQASRQIKRLLETASDGFSEQTEVDASGAAVYATALRDHEITGHGSSASWAHTHRASAPRTPGRQASGR